MRDVPLPMLASMYDKRKPILDKRGLEAVLVQDKIDGFRVMAHVASGALFSRTRQRIRSAPHVEADVRRFGERAAANGWTLGDGGIEWLDGELYTHNSDFNDLNGLMRTDFASMSTEQQREAGRLKLHVFDTIPSDKSDGVPFVKRVAHVNAPALRGLRSLAPVPFTRVPWDHDALQADRRRREAEGWEGSMLRVPGMVYKRGRSRELIKLKSFEDAEFEVVGFKAEVGTEPPRLGALQFSMNDGSGRTFWATVSGGVGTHKLKRKMWTDLQRDPSTWVGCRLTVAYFPTESKGKVKALPRFPVVKGLRAEEVMGRDDGRCGGDGVSPKRRRRK